MTARERLLRALFDTDGRRHVDIKFCRGSSGDVSPESLCDAASLALLQVDLGLVEVREDFGDRDQPTVDVAK